jgi:hypothetical protein
VCVKGEYTTEKACAKKVAGGCAACPKTVASPARQIGCLTESSDRVPKDYCIGIYKISGSPSDIGCWTPDRR